MVATGEVWSVGKEGSRNLLKYGLPTQQVRNLPGQSVVPQVGSEPCADAGNRVGDA